MFARVRAQLHPTLCDPMDYSPPGSSFHGISRKDFWSWLSFPPLGDLSDLGIEPMSPGSSALAGGFFTIEPLGSLRLKCSPQNLCYLLSGHFIESLPVL